MAWYQLFDPVIAKWLTLGVFAACFGLILYRKIRISIVSLAGGGLLIAMGIIDPKSALLERVEWNVLGIYWGYGMLALAFRDSKIPALLASYLLGWIHREKHALLALCFLAAALSSFMPNPVVVIMLAPLAIEMAERLKASLFLYLVGLAISSNVVTTVSMVADPPALILAMSTGMTFLDFYWFQGRPGLGTLSVIGVGVALTTLLVQFRSLNRSVTLPRETIAVSYGPLVLFFLSVVSLAVLPISHPGILGVVLGIASLLMTYRMAASMVREFDWETLLFLIGIFVLVGTVEKVGLLRDLAHWLSATGLRSPTLYLLILTWVSVLLSSFIDNVPYTVLMIPVCTLLSQSLGISPWPLFFGMLVGTGIGGNITPVGATANVLACGMLEKRGYRIELGAYLKVSLPFTLASVLSVHVLIQWIWL